MNSKNLLVLLLMLFVINARAQEKDSLSIARIFELGEIKITSQKSKNVVSQSSNFKLNNTDVSSALNTLPSVIFSNIGIKNESSVYIRGFDIRSIPVYIDGIPVYTTYDGYVDLGHFKTFDYSLISATKGFSPMEFGPNTIGGAINLVSLKPKEKLEIQAISGFASGNTYEYGVNIGSRFEKFYLQGSYHKSQSDFSPVSGKYIPTNFEDGGKRENSYSIDQKLNLKVGFTPNPNHEFSFNYINQKGEKGNPPYSDNDEKVTTRFWQWPAWDKQSFYFISRNKINIKSNLKVRLFYDEFYNELESFDDVTYTTQTRRYAFTSIYDDHSLGGNVVFTNQIPDRNQLNISLHYKNDIHKEYNLGEPERNFNDFTWSAGLDDVITISKKITVTGGLSFNFRKALKAEDYNSNTGEISTLPLKENSAVNEQIGTDFNLFKNNILYFYVAHRTRFATLKDRYSYRLDRNIPNPELKAEQAIHYDLSYKTLLFEKLSIDASLYYVKLNNTIQLVDDVEPGISQMQNTGHAGYKGFDFGSNYKLSNWASLLVNYSLIERKNLSNPELLFIDVPNHKIWSNLTVEPINNLEINFNAEYNSQRYSTSYGTVASAFDLYNFFASYKIKHFTIYSGVKNIFDKNYAFQEGYPAPGRNNFVKVLFHLN